MIQGAPKQFFFISERQVEPLTGYPCCTCHIIHGGFAVAESSEHPDGRVQYRGVARFRFGRAGEGERYVHVSSIDK